jgi:hypothetical protein
MSSGVFLTASLELVVSRLLSMLCSAFFEQLDARLTRVFDRLACRLTHVFQVDDNFQNKAISNQVLSCESQGPSQILLQRLF